MAIVILLAVSLPAAGYGASCGTQTNVGYKILTLSSGTKTAVWYPTSDSESSYQYPANITGNLTGSVAPNGALSSCGPFPLVLFSHGYAGCGTQSVFFTEQLARHGYVVAAPDHKDATCSVDGSTSGSISVWNLLAFLIPQVWTDASYANRKDDLELVTNTLLADPNFGGIIDSNRIAVSGHSLGGYTALGMVGGWSSWTDSRIKAALAFSPYAQPFLDQNSLGQIGVPVMYQGAPLDILTPALEGNNGTYSGSNAPKYLSVLSSGTHISWTNQECSGETTIAACLQSSSNAAAIDNYGIAFLDRHLNGASQSLLIGTGANLSLYERLSLMTSLSAASFAGVVAPNSIVTAFGDVTPSSASASQTPLPSSLAGVSVLVTDSQGTQRTASLFFASPTQVNLLLPDATQTGMATVSVRSNDTPIATGKLLVNTVAPALFSANGAGTGVADAEFVRVASDGTRTLGTVFNPVNAAPIPISLGNGGDQLYLVLYGTGMRSATGTVTATLGGVPVPVIGLAPSSQFPGLDQVNVGPIPASFAGGGSVAIQLTVNGSASNALTVSFE
jgi:uncharacterized protein (TIGR03437 family)